MTFEELDKKIEAFVSRMDDRITEIERRLGSRSEGSQKNAAPADKGPQRRGRDSSFWGIALVVIGFILLGNHFNWFDLDIPIIPAALIILGCYLLIENR